VRVDAYIRDVLVPANVAVAAMQRAGLPIDLAHLRRTKQEWTDEVLRLEKEVEAVSVECGTPIKYSEKHGVHPPYMAKFLFDGYKLREKFTLDGPPFPPPSDAGNDSSSAEALSRWASLRVPKPTDDPIATKVLQIRSLAKGLGTYLDGFERVIRADGHCHPKINWALRTARLSAEDPPVHQIPERSEKRVPDGVKACIVPRVKPARNRDDWDPRVHGSCFRWDISGAEAAIRAGMYARDPIAWDYIRAGKDIHSKTASLIYKVPEGTYKKGSYERDAVGKHTFFSKIFGAQYRAVQHQFWEQARIWLTIEQIKPICDSFDKGYAGLTRLYEQDKAQLGRNMDTSRVVVGERGVKSYLSHCEDAYGRRRAIEVPITAAGRFSRSSDTWDLRGMEDDYALLNRAFHLMANTPTQSTNASDTMFMLALLFCGEYVELRVPPMWERDGLLFPEAKGWAMHEGPGPGGKPFLAWHCNTVHDSGWGDCAPGYLEPTAKLIWRRCTAVPLDLRLESDVPYRIELKVGPDMSRMTDYNKVAKRFGLEPVPER